MDTIASFFLGLASPWEKVRGTSMKTVVDLKASKTGAKSLVKHAVNQSFYWKACQAESPLALKCSSLSLRCVLASQALARQPSARSLLGRTPLEAARRRGAVCLGGAHDL